MRDLPQTDKNTPDTVNHLKATALALLAVAIWFIGSFDYFKAQLKGIAKVPELLGLSYDEKRLDLEGPVYVLAAEARRIIPEGASIYLYNPSEREAASYFYIKLRYSLYPRKIENAGARIDADEMARKDYVMFFILPQTQGADVYSIEALPFLKKVSEFTGPKGRMAIYKVNRGVM